MRWSGAGAGVAGIALALSSCTTSGNDQATSTSSITLDAPEAIVQDDAVIRYGVSTSPSAPPVHFRSGCDSSCGLVLGAITDTLFATSTSGETVGLLVERRRANNDSTVHTWTLREGITFSDGSPFDGAAVKLNIDACRHSALTGPDLAGIDDVRADGNTLTITTLAPWGNLATHFAETPCGHMFSGSWLRSLPDLPMRAEGAPFFDAELASAAPADASSMPVGLGAFVMTSFAPGNGNSTLLERNDTYWRGPSGTTGEALPSADSVELVAIGDDATRVAALAAGQFDMIHSREPDQQEAIDALGPSTTSDAFADVVHLAINAANEGDNPLSLISCRRAVDRSIDRTALSEEFGRSPSVGPFHSSSTAEPTALDQSFDAAAATQWSQRCIEDHGDAPALELLAPLGDDRAEAIARMIESASGDAPGLTVEVVTRESSDVALAALLGDFDLLLWEGFAGVHPDLHFAWWYSEAAAPIGALSSNVGRIEDPALDRALVDLRRATDTLGSNEAAAEIERAFDAGAWTSWLSTVSWTIGFSPRLEADLTRTTPEGVALVPFVNGAHSLHRVAGG